MHDDAINAAFEWLLDRREEFEIQNEGSGEDILLSLKPIGELTLLLGKIFPYDARAKAMLNWSWSQFKQGRTFRDVVVAKPDLIVISTIYASFLRCGFRDQGAENAIRYFLKSSYCKSLELPKWRLLDIEHARVKLGLSEMSNISLEGTWISGQPEPWLASTKTVYAVTHAIFYFCDFGDETRKLSADDETYLRILLEAWLEVYVHQGNFDLIAELLMCAGYLGFEDLYRDWQPSLLRHQRDDGCFPGPDGFATHLLKPSMTASRRDFLQNYHTTIVTVLALLAEPVQKELLAG